MEVQGVRVVNHRQPRLFTDQVLATIPLWVEAGETPETIAARIGCTVGSLRTMCSIHKISLSRGVPKMPITNDSDAVIRMEVAVSARCYHALRIYGRPTRHAPDELAVLLLEQITNDGLINAVLDTDDLS